MIFFIKVWWLLLPLLFFILSLDFYLPSLRLEEGRRVGTLWYLGVGILTHMQSPSSIQHTMKRVLDLLSRLQG
jgi:hypothetical protein